MSELSDRIKRLAEERRKREASLNPKADIRQAKLEAQVRRQAKTDARKSYEANLAKARERDKRRRPGEAFKVVKVVHTDDLEELKRWGLSETPALVSPMHTRPMWCPTCEKTIPPLVYGVGHTTRTAHTHPDCPGIFTTGSRADSFGNIVRGPVYDTPEPGTGLLTGILSEDQREFTGTRAHYLACQRCRRSDISGSITSRGYVSCSECALPTHPIGWEIEENGNGGELHFTLNPAYRGEVAPGLEKALESSGLEQGMSTNSDEAMRRIQDRLDNMKKRLKD